MTQEYGLLVYTTGGATVGSFSDDITLFKIVVVFSFIMYRNCLKDNRLRVARYNVDDYK